MYRVCLFSYVLLIHSFCHLVAYASRQTEETINLKRGVWMVKTYKSRNVLLCFSQKIGKKDVIILVAEHPG